MAHPNTVIRWMLEEIKEREKPKKKKKKLKPQTKGAQDE